MFHLLDWSVFGESPSDLSLGGGTGGGGGSVLAVSGGPFALASWSIFGQQPVVIGGGGGGSVLAVSGGPFALASWSIFGQQPVVIGGSSDNGVRLWSSLVALPAYGSVLLGNGATFTSLALVPPSTASRVFDEDLFF